MSEARVIPNIVGGAEKPSVSTRTLPVTNPATAEVLAHVPMSLAADLEDAVQAATEAQKGWAATTIKDRVQVFFQAQSHHGAAA